MTILARLTGLDSRIVGKRAGLVVGGVAAALLLGGVSLGFFGLALFAVLSPALGTAGAALVVALIALVLAALVFVLAGATWQRTRREVGSAVRTNAMVTLAPPLFGMAARRAGLIGVLALGAFTFLMSRRD